MEPRRPLRQTATSGLFARVNGVTVGPFGGGVSSIFGRTGAVVAAANDYSFSQISGSLTLSQFPTQADLTVQGNVSGGTAVPTALSKTQITNLVNAFSSSLSGAAPASGGGTSNFLRADGSWAAPPGTPTTIPIDLGFVLNTGATGTNVGPELAAIRAGSLTKCIVVTKSSDPSTALTFNIKQNGTTIFSSNPSIPGGTSAGTVSDVSANLNSAPIAVAYKDVFTIDITSGNANWAATIELG